MVTPAAAGKIAKAQFAQLSLRWKQGSNMDASSWGKTVYPAKTTNLGIGASISLVNVSILY
jgi:hypothetical protein